MSDEIKQKIGHAAHDNTVIGQQNNYGLTPLEASKLAIDLFMENFPKLQEQAMETAKQRVKEFCQVTMEKLTAYNQENLSSFTDPDVQYILINAQRDYARFGTQDLLNALTSLICKRIISNDDDILKSVINDAINTAKYLNENHMDLLSLIFIAKHISLPIISMKSTAAERLEDLKTYLNFFANTFSKATIDAFGSIQNFNCLVIKLGKASDSLSKIYNINKEDIETICPSIFELVPGDYGLSYTGIVLAIINIEKKTYLNLNMKTWIK
ncbi:MAG: hypothetical protein J1F31_05930 [Erysipelotrichales bacterium]|nr:hypothetical protein [Erysipelotrichales bacterium]